MSIEERRELATALNEIYSLIGWVIRAPGGLEIAEPLFGTGEPEYAVIDPEMRDLLVEAYDELGGTRARLSSLLPVEGSLGESIDEGLTLAGLTGPSWRLKRRGWRRAIERIRDGTRQGYWIKIALKWANLILGSLSIVPVIGQLVEPLKELKDATEIQADEDNTSEDGEGGTP